MDRHEEFLRLFFRHEPDVRAFVRSVVRDPGVRDDLVQEVALACWRNFSRYDSSRSFGAWARGIAANKVLDYWKQSQRQPVAFTPQGIDAILGGYNRTEEDAPIQIDALRKCMKDLPDRSRQLLVYRYEQSLKAEGIAKRVKSTRDAVYKALARLRTALADCIRRKMAQQRLRG